MRHRIRCLVASNPDIPSEILAVLAKDRIFQVREEAAKNIKTPPKAPAKLAKDKDESVRYEALCNPSTPANLKVPASAVLSTE